MRKNWLINGRKKKKKFDGSSEVFMRRLYLHFASLFYTNKSSSLSRKTRRRKTKMCDQIYIQMLGYENMIQARDGIRVASFLLLFILLILIFHAISISDPSGLHET
jgi:hypothetical protein